jgi:hypothetical protein
MKKSDLRHGMVVETRDKLRFLVTGDKLEGKDGYLKLKEYNDDMQFGNNHQPGYISLDNFDIMKVYPTIYAFKVVDHPWLPLWERKEPPRLTNDEIAILRNIDKEYKWIARDKDRGLCIYKEQPVKQGNPAWGCRTSYADLSFFSNMFNFIQWTDDEPYNINDLLMQNKEEL